MGRRQGRLPPVRSPGSHAGSNHRAAVRHDAEAADGPVLFVQDDSCIDLTMHNAMTGRGRIGNDGGFGFVAHSCLAVVPGSPADTILGLADQTVWARTEPPRRNQESRATRRRRRTEADVWAERIESIGPCPAHALWVSVGDRAADVFSHFDRARAIGWHCLVRVCQDRRTDTGHLLETLRGLPVMATRAVTVRDGFKRQQTVVAVAWTALTLLPARLRRDARSPLPCVGLRVWDDRLEWLLVTTLPVPDAAAAQEKVDWYCRRWLVEEFHKALKTGCRLEDRQVRTADRFFPLMGFLSVVAVRLLQLRQDARNAPEAPVADAPDTVVLLARALKVDPATVATNRDFHRGIARLGGFLARKSDGEPGWQSLWLGFERFFLILLGAQLAAEIHEPQGRCG